MHVNARYINSTRGTPSQSSGCTSGGVDELCIYLHARWELLKATQVFVVVLVCCSFKRGLTPLCVAFAQVLWASFCFIFSKTRVVHFKATCYSYSPSWQVVVPQDIKTTWTYLKFSNPKCQRSSDLPSFSYEIEPIWRVWILMPGKFRCAPLHPHNWT